jgi:hypothetical protein
MSPTTSVSDGTTTTVPPSNQEEFFNAFIHRLIGPQKVNTYRNDSIVFIQYPSKNQILNFVFSY